MRKGPVILFLAFFLINFVMALSPTILTQCQTINESGFYNINSSVSSTNSCFEITADNVFLGCQGNTISYGSEEQGTGIIIEGKNTVIQNCIIQQINTSSNSPGILLSKADNTTIRHNQISTNSDSAAIVLEKTKKSTVHDNLLFSFSGITLSQSYNNEFSKNIINAQTGIIYLSQTGHNLAMRNNISAEEGIRFEAEDENTTHAFERIQNNKFNTTSYDLNVVRGTDKTYLILINQRLNAYSLSSEGIFIEFRRTKIGQIRFAEKVSGSSENLSAAGFIKHNLIGYNPSDNEGLAKPAFITLFNITNLTDPVVMKDSSICDDCSNFTLENDTATFNVQTWSTYSIANRPQNETDDGGDDSSDSGSGSSGSSSTENLESSGGESGWLYFVNWQCTDWSSCVDGVQTRSCFRQDTRGTTLGREEPALTQSCSLPEQVVEAPEPGALAAITGAVVGIGQSRSAVYVLSFFVLVLASYIAVTILAKKPLVKN